jgi:hypothetical protein
MNVEIGTEAPIILFREHLFQIFGILSLQCTLWFMAKQLGKVYPSFPFPRLPGSSLHMAGCRCLRFDAALRSAHRHVTAVGMRQNSRSSSLGVGARTVPHSSQGDLVF